MAGLLNLDDPAVMAQLQFGLGLLNAGGFHDRPIGIGQGIGMAGMGALEQYQQAKKLKMMQKLQEAQLKDIEAQAAQREAEAQRIPNLLKALQQFGPQVARDEALAPQPGQQPGPTNAAAARMDAIQATDPRAQPLAGISPAAIALDVATNKGTNIPKWIEERTRPGDVEWVNVGGQLVPRDKRTGRAPVGLSPLDVSMTPAQQAEQQLARARAAYEGIPVPPIGPLPGSPSLLPPTQTRPSGPTAPAAPLVAPQGDRAATLTQELQAEQKKLEELKSLSEEQYRALYGTRAEPRDTVLNRTAENIAALNRELGNAPRPAASATNAAPPADATTPKVTGRGMALDSKPANMSPKEWAQHVTTLAKTYPDTLAAVNDLQSTVDMAIKNAKELKTAPGKGGVVGIGSAAFPYLMRGSDAFDYKARLDNLLNQNVIQTMKSLKALSATGATGFGQLSNQEGTRLEQSVAAIKPGMKEETFDRELDKLISYMEGLKQRAIQAFNTEYAPLNRSIIQAEPVVQPSAATNEPPPGAVRRVR